MGNQTERSQYVDLMMGVRKSQKKKEVFQPAIDSMISPI